MSQQITPEEVVEMLAKVDVDGLIGKLERRNNKKRGITPTENDKGVF